jgi:hypothetical protein
LFYELLYLYIYHKSIWRIFSKLAFEYLKLASFMCSVASCCRFDVIGFGFCRFREVEDGNERAAQVKEAVDWGE